MAPHSLTKPASAGADPHFRPALVVIGAAMVIRLLWLAGSGTDLYPDEAQYWAWSLDPAWGYVTKPPLIAWLIAATTAFWGDSELAIRAAAPLLHTLTAFVVYGIGRRLFDARVGAWSAIAFATLPSISLSALIISTDVPLLLCWALATLALVRAREPGGAWRFWVLAGLAAGLGFLAKYAMGFWLVSAALFLAMRRDERRHLKGFAVTVALALAILAPNLVWNATHGFVTIHHTEANAHLEAPSFHPGAFLQFLGAQFLVMGPIFFACFLGLARAGAAWRDPAKALLLALSVPTLVVMLVESALSRAQPNWAAPTYVTATVLVVAWLVGTGRERLLQWSVVGHVALAVMVLSAGDVARAIGRPLPGHLDPLHRLHGWREIGQAASRFRAQAGMPRVLFDLREDMAAMLYYMRPHPLDAVIWRTDDAVRNQFDLDRPLPPAPGGDYLWVTTRPDRQSILDRFEAHEQLGHVLRPLGPGLAREAWIYALHGFRGYRDP